MALTITIQGTVSGTNGSGTIRWGVSAFKGFGLLSDIAGNASPNGWSVTHLGSGVLRVVSPSNVSDFSAWWSAGSGAVNYYGTSHPPGVAFTAATAAAPRTLDFTAGTPGWGGLTQDTSVSPSIVSYSWDFGDGGTSTLQNPSHTWAVHGNKTVTLTVVDSYGRTGTFSQSYTVGSIPPVAHITAADATQIDDTSGGLWTLDGDTVTASSATSTDADGTIVARNWQLTNTIGTVLNTYSGLTADIAIADDEQIYEIRLSVTDDTGEVSDTVIQQVRSGGQALSGALHDGLSGTYLLAVNEKTGSTPCVQCYQIDSNNQRTALARLSNAKNPTLSQERHTSTVKLVAQDLIDAVVKTWTSDNALIDLESPIETPFSNATYRPAVHVSVSTGGALYAAIRKSDGMVRSAYTPDGIEFQAIVDVALLGSAPKSLAISSEAAADGSGVRLSAGADWHWETEDHGQSWDEVEVI